MAQQTINASRVNTPFPTGDSNELGETPNSLTVKLQAMFTELYAKLSAQVAKFSSNAGAGPLVASAGDLTGAMSVICNYTGIGASTLTLRTAAQMFADHGAIAGQTYEVGIMNTNAGTITLTAPDGNTTITGTATIATNTTRWYEVKFTSATTMTLQNIGSGAV